MYSAIGDDTNRRYDYDEPDLHVLVDGHPTCACGQELDACSRAHCPRCGHRLHTRPRQYA